MGLISKLFGLGGVVEGVGKAVSGVAEVFTPNKTEAARADHDQFMAVLAQYGVEAGQVRKGWFDRLVDALNRLPRPALAFATIGLFWFAMYDPVSFAARMQGLALVPEPLWWLLGAVVSFYFGARELHHARKSAAPDAASVARVREAVEIMQGERASTVGGAPEEFPTDANPIVERWR